MSQSLHIIAFDIPWPPNYGGVIDVYHKLRALHRAGVGIHLHCFEYQRGPSSELDRLCLSVNYYPRQTGMVNNLGIMPYIVRSRMSEKLVQNLLKDSLPILFEGLHTCGIMGDPRLKERFMIYRESNIEHHYYLHLALAERNPLNKLFFLAESLRLRMFQPRLSRASLMLTVSEEDTKYLSAKFPGHHVMHLPSFHAFDRVSILPGKGTYALYHGKLSVAENSKVARYLMNHVWNPSLPPLVIAGMNPPAWLTRMAEKYPNVSIIANPAEEKMVDLIRNAHVNILMTFQPTGLKLKLLNSLFNGRFCLTDHNMVQGTGLGPLCTLASGPAEFRREIETIFGLEFDQKRIRQREESMPPQYSNENNCNRLTGILPLSILSSNIPAT